MKPKSSSAVRIWMVLLTAACSSDRNLPQKMCHPCDEIYVCSQTMKMSGLFEKYYIQPFFWAHATQAPRVIAKRSSADLPLTLANRGAALVIVSVHCGTLLLFSENGFCRSTKSGNFQTLVLHTTWTKQSEHIRKQTINLSLPQEYHRLLCLLKTSSKTYSISKKRSSTPPKRLPEAPWPQYWQHHLLLKLLSYLWYPGETHFTSLIIAL